MTDIHLEWVVDETSLHEAEATVNQEGGRALEAPRPFEPNEDELDDYADASFEPLIVLACALSAAALIRIVVQGINDIRYPGGEFIDLRGGKCRRRPLPSAEQGAIVIQDDRGRQYYPPAQRADALKVLGDRFQGMGLKPK